MKKGQIVMASGDGETKQEGSGWTGGNDGGGLTEHDSGGS